MLDKANSFHFTRLRLNNQIITTKLTFWWRHLLHATIFQIYESNVWKNLLNCSSMVKWSLVLLAYLLIYYRKIKILAVIIHSWTVMEYFRNHKKGYQNCDFFNLLLFEILFLSAVLYSFRSCFLFNNLWKRWKKLKQYISDAIL